MMEKDPSPFEILKSQLMQMVDVLRTEQISPEDYHLVLFLMILHRENLLNVEDKAPIWNRKDELISNLNGTLLADNEILDDIYENIYKVILERIDILGYESLQQHLVQVDKELYDKFFPDLFDDVLWILLKIQGRFSGQYHVSEEISRFAASLVEIPLHAKVYNPFAGIGSFNYFLPMGAKYFGQEINFRTWALATLRTLAHGKWESSLFLVGDSINKWNPFIDVQHPNYLGFYQDETKIKFDLIISNPPFNLRLNKPIKGHLGSIKNAEHYVIEKGLGDLTPDGKIVLFISQGFLSSFAEKHLRQHLVQTDLLETVISFPKGMLMNTSIAFSIIVINKNKRQKGVVTLVDAESFINIVSNRERKLNDASLLSEVRTPKSTDKKIVVRNEKIAKYDYNLNLPRYSQKEFPGIRIGDLGSVFRGQPNAQETRGKLVRIRDLRDDKIDFQLPTEKLQNVDLPKGARRIEESCVLLALRWKTLKPTYFNYTGTSIFISSDICAFHIHGNRVSPGYLVNELHSDYIKEQLDAYRLGEIVPFIRRDDLLRVKVNLPSINEQQSILTENFQRERYALTQGLGKKQFEEFASLKHTLGTPRQNILSFAETLISFMANNRSSELEKVNSSFKRETGVDMETALKAIRYDVNFIGELLEKGEKGLILEDYELSVLSLSDMLKFMEELCSHHNYNFISLPPAQIHNLPANQLDILGINLNQSLFKILVENIFSNAHKHAFENKEFSSNQLVIVEMGISEEGFFINILNNGIAFPKNMDKEKFITKYKTSDNANGTGMGGYDINRIALYLQSEWVLHLNTDPYFPVQFSFWFNPIPIT